MDLATHIRLTGGALKNWFIAQCQDSLAVGVLWLIGLWIIGVPWAPVWAVLAAMLQFVPHLGLVLGVIGPVFAATIKYGFLRLAGRRRIKPACYNLSSPAFFSRQSRDLLYGRVLRHYDQRN
jgi:hypothetical protein